MRATWPKWADQVSKNDVQPGDLVLMDGHVVMAIGGGKCVAARTGNAPQADQIKAGMDISSYLNRGDSIVLRPKISPEQLANAKPGAPLEPVEGVPDGGGYGAAGTGGTAGGQVSERSSRLGTTDNQAIRKRLEEDLTLALLWKMLEERNTKAAAEKLMALFPTLPRNQADAIAKVLEDPSLAKAVKANPVLLQRLVENPEIADAVASAKMTGDEAVQALAAGQAAESPRDRFQAPKQPGVDLTGAPAATTEIGSANTDVAAPSRYDQPISA